jgi:hypothetical protein
MLGRLPAAAGAAELQADRSWIWSKYTDPTYFMLSFEQFGPFRSKYIDVLIIGM